MKIINNKKEYEDFYYYKGYKPDKYPAKYPCLCEHVHEDGGINGSYVWHRITLIPNDVDVTSFIRGYKLRN